ncbi:unnamed protein product [marine sediment metagenome]|uniref:Uncharacterized protein n=1 Tax=marine sediment metagenome TaxID=412755 RepID=X0RGZ7_9ZZZZ
MVKLRDLQVYMWKQLPDVKPLTEEQLEKWRLQTIAEYKRLRAIHDNNMKKVTYVDIHKEVIRDGVVTYSGPQSKYPLK